MEIRIKQLEYEWRNSRLSATERIKAFGKDVLPTLKTKLASLRVELSDEQKKLKTVKQTLNKKQIVKLPESDTEIKLKKEGVWFGEQIIETFYQPRVDSLKKEKALVEGAIKIINGSKRFEKFEVKLEKARQVPIVDIAEHYVVRLKKSGMDRYVGSCCFHDERTPSLFFYERTNTFHCFGCRESGDVISFLQKVENINFKQAVNVLSRYCS